MVCSPLEHNHKMASTLGIVNFFGRGFLEMGLIQQAIATPWYETVIGILEIVPNDTWELFHDLQNIQPIRRGNEAKTHRVLGG